MTVITEAFTVAAQARASVLGMSTHPVVVTEHPIASLSRAEVRSRAARIVDQIAAGLVHSS